MDHSVRAFSTCSSNKFLLPRTVVLHQIISKTAFFFRIQRNKLLAKNKTKYFCIGRNKTGTTSIKKAFEDLGYRVGDQRSAELLSDKYYFKGNFAPIVAYCKSAQVFQDAPFSWSETFKHLDHAYPGSKFILTIRDDASWYQSITQFHAKKFGNGQIPTAVDLQAAKYVSKGFIYRAVKLHGAPDEDIYNKKILIDHFNRYNQTVRNYFNERPNDLLVINLSEKSSYSKFIRFLDIDSPYFDFPWENKT